MKMRSIWFLVTAAMIFGVQVSSAQIYTDLTLDTSGITTGRAIPMGNTVNDDFVVFYGLYGAAYSLKTRVVHPGGTLGPARVIAPSITVGEPKRFDVAWNPRSKSYLVVYFKGGKLWGQKVKATGAKSGAPQAITTFTGRYWTVTATVKKGFVLIMSKDGDLVAQRLRTNGKKKKGEVTVVAKTTRDFYPFDSVSTDNGTAFVVYGTYQTGLTNLYLRTLRLDGKMKVIGTSLVGVYGVSATSLTGDAYCAYDPDDDVFGLTWRFGTANTSYCIVDSSEYYVKSPTVTTAVSVPREIIYNVAKFQFMIHYQKPYIYSGHEYTQYCYLPIKPNGDVVSDGNMVFQHEHENDGWGFGVSGIGSLLVVWTPEIGPSSVFARMVSF